MRFSLVQLGMRAAAGQEGAEAMLEALKAGDWADDAAVKARRGKCRVCPSRVRAFASDWCGQPLDPEGPARTPPVCGCSVYLKTMVGSESCPQRKWAAAVPRETPAGATLGSPGYKGATPCETSPSSP